MFLCLCLRFFRYLISPSFSVFRAFICLCLSVSLCLTTSLPQSVLPPVYLFLSVSISRITFLFLSGWPLLYPSFYLGLYISIYQYIVTFKSLFVRRSPYLSLSNCFRVSHQNSINVSVYPSVSVSLNIYLAIFLGH